jgi:hypothetical protein
MAYFQPCFNALFRNGHLTKEVDLGLTIEEVKKIDKKMTDEGFLMRILYRYWGDGSYQAAWEEGTGGHVWLATDNFDEFRHKDKEVSDNGFRLKYLHSSDGYYTAIWRRGSGGQFWEVNIDFEKFRKRDEELREKGFVLMQFCDDSGKYSGFWQPGAKKYTWTSMDAVDGFRDNVIVNQDRGRLGVAFGGEQFCVVYHEETGQQTFLHGLFEKDFKSQTEELFKQDFHIVDLYMTAGVKGITRPQTPVH